eukprot:scaffold299778_cov27-Tisochrysis_lutea.AAC.3
MSVSQNCIAACATLHWCHMHAPAPWTLIHTHDAHTHAMALITAVSHSRTWLSLLLLLLLHLVCEWLSAAAAAQCFDQGFW